MATFDHQEQEQIETLKAWWKEYGATALIAILAGLIGFAGMNGWRAWKDHQQQQAASLYAPVATELKKPKPDATTLLTLIAPLQSDFPRSGITTRAVLASAPYLFDAGKIAEAQSQLQWVLDHSKETEILALTHIRLAAVLANNKQYAQALTQLQTEHPTAFDSVFAEARGDVLLLKGDKVGAKAAYQAAIGTAGDERKTSLQWKLDTLGA